MKKYLNLMALIFLILILFVSCSADESKKADAAEDLINMENIWEGETVAEAYIELNYDLSYSLEEMAEKSDVIVIGKFIINYEEDAYKKDSVKVVNPPKITQGGVEYVQTTGVIDCFKVKEVIKGIVDGKRINVLQLDADDYKYGKYSFVFRNPLYNRGKVGNEYILFLNYNEKNNYYELASEPNMILVLNGIAYVQSDIYDDSENIMFSELRDHRRTGDLIKITYNKEKVEDTITGMTLDELKEAIK